jgi:Cu-Zn family superoxide dismutase
MLTYGSVRCAFQKAARLGRRPDGFFQQPAIRPNPIGAATIRRLCFASICIMFSHKCCSEAACFRPVQREVNMKFAIGCLVLMLFAAPAAGAEPIVVEIRAAEAGGAGAALGTVTVRATPYGTLFVPELSGLAPGVHGFHVHENPSCDPKEQDGKKVPALAAGGHFDPGKTGKHLGPYGDGHLGDLPPLYVDAEGKATVPVLAPRVQIADIRGRSLMVHVGGDNFADHPHPLGGGGARIGCGVVK